ncbi:hypothetical protein IMW75_24625 [Pseudomonas gregormendelii]|uniref:Uncharacterized protein n=1 Tax=Pseudomonas gregormendelii TaxID=1628277 RepID=A0ABS3ANT8_9PSED|nr:IpaC/SipC family type III secretion system effector [Pseudomonas gregormendelii]MBN3968444.1 hypothetical protein [Pseudomonas gregormendelii]
MVTSVNTLSTSVRPQSVDTPVPAKLADTKQVMSTGSLGTQLDGQVLLAGAHTPIAAMTPQQLNQYIDTSQFSDRDSEAMMNIFVAAVASEQQNGPEKNGQDTVRDLLTFDPSAWQKHIGVLVAAIAAVNIARQSSAQMSGAFAKLAYESAVAQGVAIRAGGEAAMWAAVSGSVLAGGMAIGGAGLQIRGQMQKHSDIKFNKRDASDYDARAQEIRGNLKTSPSNTAAPAPNKVSVTTPDGTEDKGIKPGGVEVTPNTREQLSESLHRATNNAKAARMKSMLAEKGYARLQIVGSAVSSMSMMTSAALTAILRLPESAEQQKQVLRQAEQNNNRSTSDAANQTINEDTSLIAKILEAFQQLVDGRNAVLNAFASARA